MKKIITICLLMIICFSQFTYADELSEGLKGAMLVDYETGELLYEKNIDDKLPIASITKLMTYVVTKDALKEGKVHLSDIVKIGENPPKEYGSTFYLKEGDMLPLETLIESILIASANDSCVAIAEHVAGSEAEFVKMMNQKAKELGLENTVFYNPNGLPEEDKRENTMTIREINVLTQYILHEYPEILEITDKMYIEINPRKFEENTNPLLKDIPLVDGIKTGNTNAAGLCLVSSIKLPKDKNKDKEMRLIAIVMGAETRKERKEKSQKLLEYGIENFGTKEIITKDKGININLKKAKNQEVKLVPKGDDYLVVKNGDKISTKVLIDENLKLPLKKDKKAGVLEVYQNKKLKYKLDLFTNRDLKKANIFIRIYRTLFGWL
ncbi:D-alanyl-D-alanine carboxypeptidase family protein [Senegalia massiliensis]|uniref:D-alanyl-D-alanine carboxypeptidase family protein n=1 Tax=Senegalia massiliensis TaxID=1720316 RepID=UPI00102FD1B0|nr:D-alanyl-D-alanine carboxypeptidase family protein [Senegalia massiliensis]